MSRIWYEKCFIQLDVEKKDFTAVQECLEMFLDDPRWLRSCVNSSLEMGSFVLKKYEFDTDKIPELIVKEIYNTDVGGENKQEVLKEEQNDNQDKNILNVYILGDQYNQALNTEIKNDSIVERVVDLPRLSEIRIIKNEMLPEWFVEFYKQTKPHLQYSIHDLFLFQLHGSRGDVAPTKDPEFILKMLVKKGLSLACQENSESRKELLLRLISFYIENGITARLDRAKISSSLSYPYSYTAISTIATTVKNKMKQLNIGVSNLKDAPAIKE